MKRYLLFGGEYFYARGGWHDSLGDFDLVEDAAAKGRELRAIDEIPSTPFVEWWHVIDTETGEIVAGTYQQALGAKNLEDGEPNPLD